MKQRYRVGRHLGRTVYRVVGTGPSERDELIGVMDTASLGALVVEALNAREDFRAAERRPTDGEP